MIPLANLFKIFAARNVVTLQFQHQLEKDGPLTDVAVLALGREDAISLHRVLGEVLAKEAGK
jgi:hypothetical protein